MQIASRIRCILEKLRYSNSGYASGIAYWKFGHHVELLALIPKFCKLNWVNFATKILSYNQLNIMGLVLSLILPSLTIVNAKYVIWWSDKLFRILDFLKLLWGPRRSKSSWPPWCPPEPWYVILAMVSHPGSSWVIFAPSGLAHFIGVA